MKVTKLLLILLALTALGIVAQAQGDTLDREPVTLPVAEIVDGHLPPSWAQTAKPITPVNSIYRNTAAGAIPTKRRNPTVTDASEKPDLWVFAGPTAFSVKAGIGTATNGEKTLTSGPGASVGGFFVGKDLIGYAKGTYGAVWDFEVGNTRYMQLSAGAIYAPGYFGAGVGISHLTRPSANIGELGVNVLLMFKYPVRDRMHLIGLVDVTLGALDRTTQLLTVGASYQINKN